MPICPTGWEQLAKRVRSGAPRVPSARIGSVLGKCEQEGRREAGGEVGRQGAERECGKRCMWAEWSVQPSGRAGRRAELGVCHLAGRSKETLCPKRAIDT